MTEVLVYEAEVPVNKEQYFVSIHEVLSEDRLLFYRCVFNNIKTYRIMIDENGTWVDCDNGVTELSKVLGEIIESQAA